MNWLNSGVLNRHNYFTRAIFLFQKTGNDSVDNSDSGDIKILAKFPGNSILEFWLKYWNCVGGTHMRGCFVHKITK